MSNFLESISLATGDAGIPFLIYRRYTVIMLPITKLRVTRLSLKKRQTAAVITKKRVHGITRMILASVSLLRD